ncbi:hypothetical protein FB451DRAFT_1414350 [Mycena latifolia]|nr:hypothetical protein FB451DRAFT_1414350 [Mycena latifolia]
MARAVGHIMGHGSDTDDNFDFEAAYNILLEKVERQKKRKRDEPATSTTSRGRGIRKIAALFGDIATILADTHAYERNPYEEDDDSPNKLDKDLTDEQLKWLDDNAERNYEAYVVIERLLPNLSAQACKLSIEACHDWFTLIQKGANNARSDDLRRVTRLLGEWINEDIKKPELAVFDHTPSTTVTDEDTGETIEHDLCGALLMTIDMDWKNPKRVVCLCFDPVADSSLLFRVREKFRSPNRIVASFFLRIFYNKFQGDPKHVEVGFLKSRYLVKSYMAIFTAPSSADDYDEENTPPTKRQKNPDRVEPSGRPPVAEILGMGGKATGRSIAYTCAHLFLALTTAVKWSPQYYGVSVPQMYDFIVDFFEAPKPETQARERADALLTWWNTQVFPMHASSAATHRTSVDSRAQLHAQRAAMEL